VLYGSSMENMQFIHYVVSYFAQTKKEYNDKAKQ
jgi:hypothetical protein